MEYLSSNSQDMLWEPSIIMLEDVATCIQSMRIERGDTHEGTGEELGQMVLGAGSSEKYIRVAGFYFGKVS